MLGAPSSAPAQSHRCPNRHGHVIKANSEAEVYVGFAPIRPGNQLPIKAVLGCALTSGRAYELGPPPHPQESPGTFEEVSELKLAGHMVAFERLNGASGHAPGHLSEEVWVIDLRNGRVIHRAPTGEPPLSSEGVGRGSIVGLAVRGNGSVAWINGFDEGRPEREVHVLDRRGARILASSPDIEPHSLTLHGSVLHWTERGRRFSAAIH